jgi:hypothetical protein
MNKKSRILHLIDIRGHVKTHYTNFTQTCVCRDKAEFLNWFRVDKDNMRQIKDYIVSIPPQPSNLHLSNPSEH